MKLDELLAKVNSKETFLDFIEELRKDKVDEDENEKINPTGPFDDGKNGWVNVTIAQFLESVHAFGSENDKLELEWSSIARLFYSGKFYE